MTEPLFHPEAYAEYTAAIHWYEQRSARAGSRFEAEVGRVLEQIVANPQMFPKYNEEHRFAILRRFPYSVVFQIHQQQAYVIAMAHASRSPDYWQGRR